MKETKPYQGKVTVEKYSNAVLMESGRILCTANPSTFSQHSEEANAAEIARRWNAFPDAVRVIRMAQIAINESENAGIEFAATRRELDQFFAKHAPATVK
jgi:hypothetical protein